MAKPLGSMFIELGLDTSQFNPKLHSAKRAVNYFKAETRGLDSVLKRNGQSVQGLQAKMQSLKQMISSQETVLKSLKKNMENATPGTDRWEKAAVAIQRENAQLEAMKTQLNQVEIAIKQVHAENSRWGKLSTALKNGADRAKHFGETLRNMGDAMKPVSTLLSAGFGLATRKAMDFEGQMQVTKSLLADTAKNTSELNTMTSRLGESSKKWARDYGISTSSINEGMQEIIKKGFDFNQTIAAMPAILNASKASGEDFNTVMNASTNILQQFGLQAKDTGRVTDVLTYVANKTAAGFGDMGNAMEYVGPVAKNVGMSLEETAAAVGLLSNNGIAGEKAGTALRGALSRLLDPSKEASVAMGQLGFSAEEFKSGAIKLPDILDRIRQNTKGMTDAQKSALIAQAFGVQSQTAMNILVDQGADKLRALTEETKNAKGYTKGLADEMQKSGKSSAERFKSALEVLQITIGQKLLPILTPFIEKTTKLVEQFAKADPTTQKFAIGLGLILAGAYPVLNVLGNASTVMGGFLKLLSKGTGRLAATGKGLELLQVGSSAASTGMTSLGTATAGTTGHMGLLANASAFLSNPAVLVAGSLAVAGAIAYFGAQAEEARIRTETWGTKVSQVEAEELESFKGKVDDTNKAMVDFATGAVDGLADVKTAFSELNKEVQGLLDKELEDDLKIAKKLGLSPEAVAELKKSAQTVKDNVQQMSDEVIAIYQNASNEHRQLTEEEKRIVLANQNALINEQLTLMKFSKKERVALQKAINGDLEGLEQEQLAKAKATLRQWITEEQKSYKERKANYKEMLQSITGTGKEAVAERAKILADMERLEAEHQAKLEAYGIKYGEIYQAWIEKATKGVDSSIRKTYEEELRHTLEDLGVSYEEFVDRASRASNKLQEGHSMWAQTLADASDEARSANILWNEMTWDLKKGVLESNVQEKIQEALQAEQGWEGMKFILKHANLSTNAKIAIGEALVATGQWDSLSPEEKHLVVDGKPAVEALIQSKEHLAIWNSMPEEVKHILGENESFMSSADGAMQLLTAWNLLLPIDKELKAHNLTSGDVKLAQDTINSLMGKTVNIDADNRTGKPVAEATNAINNALQYKPAPIDAVDQTAGAVASSTTALNNVEQHKPAPINADDKTGQPVSTATKAINDVQQHNPAKIDASDQTAAGVNSANAKLATVKDKTVTITTIWQDVKKLVGLEKGTDFHQGGLAMVNDQRGSLYKELVTLPSGESFIPKGRNVILPLPRGSKVLTASRTKHLMERLGVPRYADGVGIPEDAKIFRDMARAERGLSSPVVVQQDTSKLEGLLREIVYLLSRQATDKGQGRSDVYLNETKVGEMVTDYMRKKERMENRMWGISP